MSSKNCAAPRGFSLSKGSLIVATTILSAPLLAIWSPAALAAAAESADAAQPGALEEIVVTAEKRSERVVDVPISITSVSGATLQSAGVTGTMDLQQAVPGLRLDESGSNVSPSIRGIGSALA